MQAFPRLANMVPSRFQAFGKSACLGNFVACAGDHLFWGTRFGAFSRIMVVTGGSVTLPTHDVQAGDRSSITAADIAVDGTCEYIGFEDWERDVIFPSR